MVKCEIDGALCSTNKDFYGQTLCLVPSSKLWPVVVSMFVTDICEQAWPLDFGDFVAVLIRSYGPEQPLSSACKRMYR